MVDRPEAEGTAEEPQEPQRGPAGGSEAGEAGEAGGPGAKRRGSVWRGIVGLLLLVIAGMYAWKLVAVGEARREAEAARDTLQARASRAIDLRMQELLRLSAVPLGWAVRSEILRRNWEQANAFLTELVQEPGVERIVIGGPRDSILLATDKVLEGRAFSSLFPVELLRGTEPSVARLEDGGYRVAVPLLGPTRTLGVLVLSYRPEEIRLVPEAPQAPAREGSPEETPPERPDTGEPATAAGGG